MYRAPEVRDCLMGIYRKNNLFFFYNLIIQILFYYFFYFNFSLVYTIYRAIGETLNIIARRIPTISERRIFLQYRSVYIRSERPHVIVYYALN